MSGKHPVVGDANVVSNFVEGKDLDADGDSGSSGNSGDGGMH